MCGAVIACRHAVTRAARACRSARSPPFIAPVGASSSLLAIARPAIITICSISLIYQDTVDTSHAIQYQQPLRQSDRQCDFANLLRTCRPGSIVVQNKMTQARKSIHSLVASQRRAKSYSCHSRCPFRPANK